ncbi:MAG: hypothetical protein ACOCWM_01615 [Cyclobacteriaceae bacterium]
MFNSFSYEIQQALPLKSAMQFFNSLNNQVGKIECNEFISYQQESYAIYKTKFENRCWL